MSEMAHPESVLKEAETLLANITPGEWELIPRPVMSDRGAQILYTVPHSRAKAYIAEDVHGAGNAAFFVAAPRLIRALLTYLRGQEAEQQLPKGNLPWCPRCVAIGPQTIPINDGRWNCLECGHEWTPPQAAGGPPKSCKVVHPETGAVCVLVRGHAENHRGSFPHGIAQWPRPDSLLSAGGPPKAEESTEPTGQTRSRRGDWVPVRGEESDDWGIRHADEQSGQSIAQMLWDGDAIDICRIMNSRTSGGPPKADQEPPTCSSPAVHPDGYVVGCENPAGHKGKCIALAGEPNEFTWPKADAALPQEGEQASKVTRFEVIDHRPNIEGREPRGRVLSLWGRIELSYQDQGRTLKVFVTGGEPPASLPRVATKHKPWCPSYDSPVYRGCSCPPNSGRVEAHPQEEQEPEA